MKLKMWVQHWKALPINLDDGVVDEHELNTPSNWRPSLDECASVKYCWKPFKNRNTKGTQVGRSALIPRSQFGEAPSQIDGEWVIQGESHGLSSITKEMVLSKSLGRWREVHIFHAPVAYLKSCAGDYWFVRACSLHTGYDGDNGINGDRDQPCDWPKSCAHSCEGFHRSLGIRGRNDELKQMGVLRRRTDEISTRWRALRRWC